MTPKSDATLKEAQKSLIDRFDISITQSGLQRHLVNKCGVTMKNLERISEYCNSDETITSRMNWAHAFQTSGTGYYECAFIDKADFNMHIQRNSGRSRRGTSAEALVSRSCGVNMTILGATTGEDVVNLSLRRPQAVVASKNCGQG